MDKIKCLLCDKEVSNNNSYIGSHVKRKHGMLLEKYAEKFYKNLNPSFKIEKCGFCDEDAIYVIEYNHINKTFIKNYNNGYKCSSEICKNNISLSILGHKYDKKTFEHIGSNVKYLSKLYKKSKEEIIYSKSKGFRESTFTTTLENFIKKYGKEEGTKKYFNRCNKISKANTKKWYVEKFGKEEGTLRWNKKREKMAKGALGPSKSKQSEIISDLLKEKRIKYIKEYVFEKWNGQNGSIDYYLPEYNTVIEFYGDWWHCNPNIYEKDYNHKILKISASEIWERDKKRIKYIFENVFEKKPTIIILWASTKINSNYLYKLLQETKNKKTILEI